MALLTADEFNDLSVLRPAHGIVDEEKYPGVVDRGVSVSTFLASTVINYEIGNRED